MCFLPESTSAGLTFATLWTGFCPGVAQGDGPASAKAVCDSSNPAAVHQLPEPEPVPFTHLETDEATHASRSHANSMKSYGNKCVTKAV